MINITEVKLRRMDKGDLLCYASICIEGVFVIDGIKLLNGKNGRYIKMASRRLKNSDRQRNYAYPINNETRIKILNEISEEYDNTTN